MGSKTKTFEFRANVPMQVHVKKPLSAGEREKWNQGDLTEAEAAELLNSEDVELAIGGGEEECAQETCRINLPVQLLLEVRVRADCRVRDIACGRPS